MQQIKSLYLLKELKYVTSLTDNKDKTMHLTLLLVNMLLRMGTHICMVPLMAPITFNHPLVIFWLAAAAIHSEVLTVS